MTIPENYEYVKSQIDIDNFIIHNVIQIYGDNRDWPGNNIKFWKSNGGKWRWILYDTDFSFSGQWWDWSVNNHYLINSLDRVLSGIQTNWANAPWSTLILRKLIQNTEFRNKFVNRYADEINTRFLASDVVQHFNDIYDVILDEVPDHIQRWNSDDDPYNYVELMINFAVNRPEYAKEHILSELDLPNYHKVSLENSTPEFGFIRVNNNLKIQELAWNGDYFEEVPITLKAVPEFGYAFSHWSGANNSTDEEIILDINNDKFVEAHFVEDQTPTDLNIVINEINYKSSDDFNSNDWVELYNPNSYAVDISNWIFNDDNDANVYEFPENTIIQQESYLVVVKDIDDFSASFSEISDYVGEFDFGLSSSSDAVRLFNSEMVIQDEVYYTSSFPWPNLGNGDGYTLELISPSLDNSLPENWTNFNEHGSPNEVNSPTANINSTEQIKSVLWPNPVENTLNITLNINYLDNYTIELYDLKGVNLKEIFRGNLDLGDSNLFYNTDNLSAGVYLIKISSDNGINKIMKFIKR